jgi:hypothetical protein
MKPPTGGSLSVGVSLRHHRLPGAGVCSAACMAGATVKMIGASLVVDEAREVSVEGPDEMELILEMVESVLEVTAGISEVETETPVFVADTPEVVTGAPEVVTDTPEFVRDTSELVGLSTPSAVTVTVVIGAATVVVEGPAPIQLQAETYSDRSLHTAPA